MPSEQVGAALQLDFGTLTPLIRGRTGGDLPAGPRRALACRPRHVRRAPRRHPRRGPLAVFDWLESWFRDPAFRGCAFVNSFGELGAVSKGVARAARDHKQAVHAYLSGLVRRLPVAAPEPLARQFLLLLDGATTTAAISGDPAAARAARGAAATPLAAALAQAPATG